MPTPFRHWLRPSTPAKTAPKARLRVEPLEERDVPATFAVTTTADSGVGSLRQAITDANSTAGADTIAFSIGSGPVTISPLSNLPQVTDAVTIDGWSQPGFAGTPIVELSGASAGNAWGLIVGATATVRGLVVNRFTYDAIHVEGAGSVGTRVQGCYLGTDIAGTSASPNGYAGVAVWPGTAGTVIGTDGDGVNDAAEGNLISGNANQGVWVSGPGTPNTVIAGNRIGTNAAGTAAVGNGDGVYVRNGATGTRIGTNGDGVADALETNVISGNRFSGVAVVDGGTNGTVVAGNFIGTNAAGAAALGNVNHGVLIAGGATNSRVGTNGDGVSDAPERNVISGNKYGGILLSGGSGAAVAGNYIGVNALGTAAIPNLGDGIWVNAMTNVRIGTDGNGTADADEGNVISGNGQQGIVAGNGTVGTVIAGNRIGTNAAGIAAVSNGTNYPGIKVYENSRDVRIGTDGNGTGDAAERNLISGNSGAGVQIESGSSNVVAGNFIGTNASGTAALGNGVGVKVLNGATGTRVGTNGDGVGDAAERNVISGNADIGVTVVDAATRFTVVAGNFIGTNAAGTAALTNRGNAGVLVSGAADTRVGTNGDGSGDAAERNVISGNTQEGIQIEGGAARTVVAGNFVGTNAAGTAAVANGFSGVLVWNGATATRIGTNGNGSGDADEGNVISGNSSFGVYVTDAATAGTVIAGNRVGTNAAGTAALGNTYGLYIAGGARNTRVGTNGDGNGDAEERNVVSGNLNDGVFVLGGATGTVVAGNSIGTNAAGTVALRNGNHGVRIEGGAVNTRVGTNGDGNGDAAEGNLISGNTYDGVSFWVGGAVGTVIAGNLIGTNSAGTGALPNGRYGVWVNSGATNTRVGTNADGVSDALERNVISGNGADGVQVADATTTGTVIAGNFIGTNAAGTAAVGNLGVGGGVYIRNGASNTTVGGTAAGAGNVLSGNSGVNGDGVEIELSSGNFVYGNRIGTDATGTFAVPNRQNGVNLDRASGNVVGGPAPGAGNLISGNTRTGVLLGGSAAAATTANTVQGNRIGTDATGTAALPNLEEGVLLLTGAGGNTVGTNGDGVTDAAEGNVIAFNGLQGVSAAGGSVAGNSFRGNAIFGNGGLGIDLNGDGVTPNDPLDADAGPNGLQNFPLITARTGFATRVAGVLRSQANTTYVIDFYANPTGTAQGARFLGTVSVTTDAAGTGHFDATLPALTAAGEAITATATDPAGNTSEFSAAATPPLSVESVVVNQGQAQRSMVTRIDVTFSGVLPAVDATAFALTRVGGPGVGLVVAAAVVGGKTVVTVTFTGPGVSANSLADGNYAFTIDGAKLLDAAGRRVDADGDGLAGGTGATSLFRLFGDSDGDRDVDTADFFRLRTALLNPGLYATYAYFDFNGDGVVTAADRAAFDARRGTTLLP